jgi:penicillin-binding protein 1A
MSPRPRREPAIPREIVRARRRRQRVRTRGSARKRRFAVLGALALALLVGGLAAGGLTAATTLTEGCDLDEMKRVHIGENSFVYAADGSLLGAIPSERNRQPIRLDQMSKWIKRATVAIEDRRFYQHDGVDFEGIARALWADIRAGKAVQGGSTITQQVVRNLYGQRERTIRRKIREACLALQLNDRYSKQWILRTYLNHVYYGNHAYGIEAAAQTYFSKPASKLSIAQAAMLAGLPQAPSNYDPFEVRRKVRLRRNAVLRAMFETGQISRRQYRQTAAKPIKLRPGRLYQFVREPYFFSYVRDLLVREYGERTVRMGGLRVYTTIDPRLQRVARQIIRNTLYLETDPDAALVSISPRTGAIRAMVAVTRRKDNQFNLAVQARRQAGSTFKTFVLTAAIATGINPDWATYTSAPLTYTSPTGETWEVSTYDGSSYGSSSVSTATLRSDNTVYAQLTLDVEAWRVVQMARRLGIDRSPLPVVPSVGLGSASVSPLEMSVGYATLAAGGVYSRPLAIRKVIKDGEVDRDAGWGTVQRQRVIADWVAAEVTDLLEQNILAGTGTAAQIARPAAGKTGTTDDHADAWFAGYTPSLQTTVWVGHIRGRVPMENVHGISVAGGTFPAQIWGKFMLEALRNVSAEDFPAPTTEPIWRSFEPGSHAITFGSHTDSYGVTTTPPPASPEYSDDD